MSEPKIINCGHCRPRRRGIVKVGTAPPPDDIIVRLRRAYDETGNSLLRDAMTAIADARRAADRPIITLQHIRNELEERMDADDGKPNWAMSLVTEIDEALGKAGVTL